WDWLSLREGGIDPSIHPGSLPDAIRKHFELVDGPCSFTDESIQRESRFLGAGDNQFLADGHDHLPDSFQKFGQNFGSRGAVSRGALSDLFEWFHFGVRRNPVGVWPYRRLWIVIRV